MVPHRVDLLPDLPEDNMMQHDPKPRVAMSLQGTAVWAGVRVRARVRACQSMSYLAEFLC
jgi:hypothetical protein